MSLSLRRRPPFSCTMLLSISRRRQLLETVAQNLRHTLVFKPQHQTVVASMNDKHVCYTRPPDEERLEQAPWTTRDLTFQIPGLLTNWVQNDWAYWALDQGKS